MKALPATMDWMGKKKGKRRGVTITSAAPTTCFWNNHRINIIIDARTR